jgi:hypothetical protein
MNETDVNKDEMHLHKDSADFQEQEFVFEKNIG